MASMLTRGHGLLYPDQTLLESYAKQEASDLYRCLYFKTHPNTEVEAVVVSVRQNGVIVFVPRYGFKGPVYLRVCAHSCLITRGRVSVGVRCSL